VTTSGPGATYRYVADGRLAQETLSKGRARARSPLAVATLVVVGLTLGVATSLSVNAASLPTYRSRVVLIGVVWGLAWALLGAAIIAVLVGPVAAVVARRTIGRTFAVGSVTEVELAEDALVLRRPTGIRTVPYRRIFRLRKAGMWLRVEVRGRVLAELLPVGLLPDAAIDYVRARARGASPLADVGDQGRPDHEWVVPAGWAAHAAATHARETLRTRRFWIRVGIALLVAASLAAVAGPAWLLVVPLFASLFVAVTYGQARKAVAAVLPTGSVASTRFLDDRFVSSNAGGTREISYDDVRRADLRGDVVVLTLSSQRGRMLIARDLVPDEIREQFAGAQA
jgi:hypothetical protein